MRPREGSIKTKSFTTANQNKCHPKPVIVRRLLLHNLLPQQISTYLISLSYNYTNKNSKKCNQINCI